MLTHIRKFLDLLSGTEKQSLSFMFIAQLGVAFVDTVGVASILPFIAVVSNPDTIQTNRWLKTAYEGIGFSSVQSFLFTLGMLVLGLLVISNLYKALTSWLILKYDNRLNYTLARRLLGAYLACPYEFFLGRNTVHLGRFVLGDARMVIAGVLSPVMRIVSSALVAVFLLMLLIFVNVYIAVSMAFLVGVPYGLIYLVAARHLSTLGKDQWDAHSTKYSVVHDALSGIKDLKILGRAGFYLKKFSDSAWRHSEVNIKAGVISQLPRFALETIAFGGILSIVLVKLGTGQNPTDIIPVLALYALAGYRLLPAIQDIFSNMSTVTHNLSQLEVVHREMCDARNAAVHGHDLSDGKQLHPLPFTRTLCLRNIVYAYPGTQEAVLDGLNVTILPNTSIGIVGATGSGKTTMVDLILGLFSPTAGQLLVDGVEITCDNVTGWQQNIGYVPQQIYLSDDTIARNIAFGVPDQERDMQAMVRAARIANLHAFIEQDLPDGYNTIVGERGVRLSGGQRQRIGIARALYRDPSLLIMDEATSALDNVTEEAVIEALRTLSGKKTIIMIAHRLTTVKECDVIYLMENGHITSQGTYDELMKASAWFKAAARTGT